MIRRPVSGVLFGVSVLLLLITALYANVGTPLSGALPRSVKAEGGPYLVTSTVSVPSGKTVTIEAGTVLLFRNFSGLHVEGQLVVEGSAQRPVVFTSEFDGNFNPSTSIPANPYDWNGIYLHEGAIGSTLKHFKVLYSVHGINALTKFIRIEQGVFAENGRADLTIEGVQHRVSREPYSYALTIHDAKIDGVPVKILMDPQAPRRTMLRYTGLGAIVGGGSLTLWFASMFVENSRRLRQLSDRDNISGPDHNLVQHLAGDWETAHARRARDIVLITAACGISAAGTVGFVWSFTF